MLFALSDLARCSLARAWQAGGVIRVYRALVSGVPDRAEFTIETPIGPVPHPLLGRVHGASSDGKPARSRIALLEQREGSALVQVLIETGRTHQIRIHLAAAGLPLVGDPLYPKGGVPTGDTKALPGDLGYWLHAERLAFRHPESAAKVELGCLPPPPLRLSAQDS